MRQARDYSAVIALTAFVAACGATGNTPQPGRDEQPTGGTGGVDGVTGGTGNGGAATGGAGTGGDTATGGAATGGEGTGGTSSTCSTTCTAAADGLEGTFCDDRDQSIYRCVVIGSQVWMGENLDYGVQVDATLDQSAGHKYCYDNLASYCDTLGGLYQWHTALGLDATCDTTTCSGQISSPQQGACPNGWHVPTSDEWSTLVDAAEAVAAAEGYDQVEEDGAGSVLRASAGCDWADNLGGGPGTDDLGFTACAGGGRYTAGYSCMGTVFTTADFCFGRVLRGMWWTTREGSATEASFYDVSDDQGGIARISGLKAYGFALRCLQD